MPSHLSSRSVSKTDRYTTPPAAIAARITAGRPLHMPEQCSDAFSHCNQRPLSVALALQKES